LQAISGNHHQPNGFTGSGCLLKRVDFVLQFHSVFFGDEIRGVAIFGCYDIDYLIGTVNDHSYLGLGIIPV
jgi:hypothetical protein